MQFESFMFMDSAAFLACHIIASPTARTMLTTEIKAVTSFFCFGLQYRIKLTRSFSTLTSVDSSIRTGYLEPDISCFRSSFVEGAMTLVKRTEHLVR